jgi:hypothetical protein
MTTEQRQFFAACVAAALFLGGADIGGHAGSADPVQPLTDRPALAPVRLQLAPVRSAPELIASLARAANMDGPYTPKKITRNHCRRRHLAGDRGLDGVSCHRIHVGSIDGVCQLRVRFCH